jgi:hypothetical protein
MTKVLIEPMPHEFVPAHAGRIAFLFRGQTSKNQRQSLVARLAQEHHEGAASWGLLQQLAVISGMGATDYARQHSMLPTLRVASREAAPALHGSVDRPEIAKFVGSRLHSEKVHLCRRCVAEDISHWGFSWFRRTHNLAGIEVCPVHGDALHLVNNPDPFSLLPQHWVDLDEVECVEHESTSAEETKFQTRLQETYELFLDRDRPFDLHSIYVPLARRVHEIGLRNSEIGKKPPLSDYVRSTAPSAWLARHWPQLCKKEPGAFFSALDRLPGPTVTPGTGFAYVVAFASLFQTTEDAARSLAMPVARRTADEKSVMKSQYSPEFWTTDFLEVFANCAGNITAIAKQLHLDRNYVARKTKSLGLPSFKGVSSSAKWRALEKFGAGASLVSACADEGVDPRHVEELLRIASSTLLRTVKSVKKDKQRRPLLEVLSHPRACYELPAAASTRAAAGSMSTANTRKCSPPSTSGSRS